LRRHPAFLGDCPRITQPEGTVPGEDAKSVDSGLSPDTKDLHMNEIDIAAISAGRAGIGQTELKLNYLRSPNADSDPEKLRGAARELEAYFIHFLIREMRKTIPPNPILHGGKAEEIFQDFLDEEMAGEMARAGQLGLADLIFDNLQNLLKQRPENADKYL